MRHHIFAAWVLLATLLLLAVGLPARAACEAGNPNTSVIESTPTADFTINGDGTVTHAKTGLMWKQCAEGLSGAGCAIGTATTVIWRDALNAANSANTGAFAGYSDWRLPNVKELQSIVEECGYRPNINQTVFPNAYLPSPEYAFGAFWSSTSYVRDLTLTPWIGPPAWVVSFISGGVADGFKLEGNWVRLVRGGQRVDSF